MTVFGNDFTLPCQVYCSQKTPSKNYKHVILKKLAHDERLRAAVETEAVNAAVAVQIYRARRAAGLTQQQLARRVGTQQSVIARLEDADYGRHSLRMLERIADALDKRIEVRFVGRPRRKKAARDPKTAGKR